MLDLSCADYSVRRATTLLFALLRISRTEKGSIRRADWVRLFRNLGRSSANVTAGRSQLSCFYGISRALKGVMHATFFQKVIICAVAGLAAASLIEWARVFVEGADKALNGGYEHRTVMGSEKK